MIASQILAIYTSISTNQLKVEWKGHDKMQMSLVWHTSNSKETHGHAVIYTHLHVLSCVSPPMLPLKRINYSYQDTW